MLEVNVQADHVHLIVSIPPKYAVSNVVWYLKGKLAIRLLSQNKKVKRKYWGRYVWSRGYCVSTIGIDEEKIRKYVKWQEKREKQAEAIQQKMFDWLNLRSHLLGAILLSHRLWRW